VEPASDGLFFNLQLFFDFITSISSDAGPIRLLEVEIKAEDMALN